VAAERTPDLEAACAEQRAKMQATDREHVARDVRRQEALSGMRLGTLDLQAAAVLTKFTSVWSAQPLPAHMLAKHGMQQQLRREHANLFIVPEPANAGQRISWILAIKGGACASLRYATSGGQDGEAIVFTRGAAGRRRVWCSAAWAARHGGLNTIVQESCRSTGWTCMAATTTVDEFLAKPSGSAIGLVTPSDLVQTPVPPHVKPDSCDRCHVDCMSIACCQTAPGAAGPCQCRPHSRLPQALPEGRRGDPAVCLV
jgi:hypothetical protein